MKLIILLTLFSGILFVIHGIYEEKIKNLEKEVKVEYRFIPRSYYDEQLFSNQFSSKFSNLFDEDQSEWSANQRSFKKFTDKELNKAHKKKNTNNMPMDESGMNSILETEPDDDTI
jgi:hypothetical protein